MNPQLNSTVDNTVQALVFCVCGGRLSSNLSSWNKHGPKATMGGKGVFQHKGSILSLRDSKEGRKGI